MNGIDQMMENIGNWDYVSYNSISLSVGPWIASAGRSRGDLTMKSVRSGSTFEYRIENANVGVGLSTLPVDVDISAGTYQSVVGSYPAPGMGGMIFGSMTKALSANDFAGPCLFYSCSGGFNVLALGYNYIALGVPYMPVSAGYAPSSAEEMASKFKIAAKAAKAVIFEVSTCISLISANIGHNLGIGHATLTSSNIAPSAPGQIGTIGSGPSTSPDRSTYRTHIVKPGESLSKISMQYFGTYFRWEDIYKIPENKRRIGANPNFILPQTQLLIPN